MIIQKNRGKVVTDAATPREKFKMVAKTMVSLEEVLADELREMGAENVAVLNRAVEFEGDMRLLYRANYSCRTALAILKPFAEFDANDDQELYDQVYKIRWEKILDCDCTFMIDSTTSGEVFTHSYYAALKTNFSDLNLYGFVTDSNEYDYYNSEGKSVRKTLLKTPVANARISSTYGKRTNPVYGYESFHKGLDFAAPLNTPILASGSGTVELAGWFDIYGNCIILRHSNGYKTLYGHMNAYGKGIKKGVRVKQGQIIGYIGTTGMSTGPHLHYEVIFNDVKINPASVKSPPERNLTKNELERFNKRKAQIDELFENLKKKD